MVSFGDALDQTYEAKADHAGSQRSLLERARTIPLPVSRAGSLVNLEFAGNAPFLTFDRVPSVPKITQTDENDSDRKPQAINSVSLLEAAIHSPLPVSRSPSFSAPFTTDLEANVDAVFINTSHLINTETSAKQVQQDEPEPTPIVYPVDRPILAPFQVTQQVSAQQRDLVFIDNLSHEQLVQLAKTQYQQIQELHSIREQEVEHLSRSLSQARAENTSLRNKILQLSQQQPGSRSMSKQSSFADLPSTLQQALSCDSVDDAINLIKNEPLAVTVPVAEVQPLQQHDTLVNAKAQSRHGSKQELAKKYGSGMISVRSMRKDKANDSAMDIEKIRLKEDLTATTMENERLLEYLHLLISRIMEVPEAIKVLASPIGGGKSVMGKS
ncbi:hypothetical protein BCR44DRAFT_1437254 [Catenaria anguillulae PL171]|uniref:FIP-RBD domain-containing protein n=1 Tax=Catenaria anguillulae PL171 TaxID=765915 RepID=A0A1Y2HJ62_9FUNG|nr:hypothetical protein BCR44DRAFT_1437254 [Catenaria anguillulae PL171]